MKKLKDIEWTEITSGMISAVSFDLPTQILYVRFARGGAVWSYSTVTFEMYKEFLGANSMGKHFHANIKSLTSQEIRE